MSELDPEHVELLDRYRRATAPEPAAVERELTALLADPRARAHIGPRPRPWLGLGWAIGGAIGAFVLVVLAVRSWPSRAPMERPAAIRAVEQGDATPPPTSPPSPSPLVGAAPVPASTTPQPASDAPPSSPSPARPRPLAPEASAPTPASPSEIELMVDARQALRAGDHAAALTVLERHLHAYPTGQLEGERDLSRVVALCHLGRHAAAHQLAAAIGTRPALAAVESVEGCAD